MTTSDDKEGTRETEKSPDSMTNHKKRKQGSRDSIMDRWLNNYVDKVDKYRARLPNFVGSAIATACIFLLASCYRGEWMLLAVHFLKRLGYNASTVDVSSVEYDGVDRAASHSISSSAWERLLEDAPYLRTFGYLWLSSTIFSYSMYIGLGLSLHYYYYVKKRDKPEEWKCQPYKWLSPQLERHEIILGMSSLLITNTVTSVFATYIFYDGPCMIYYNIDDYGWLWYFLQWPTYFVIVDYITYWFHRIYHTPTLYRLFHKLHHTYKQPTAWSATAIHPVEIVHVQLFYLSILFVIPIHLVTYYGVMVYMFYHGILDHSGINFKAQWWQPWQPDASFHDSHHQYTHVNFSFNVSFWDKLHGTYRRKDRIYNEDIFYGQGKKISAASKEELIAELEQRNSEHADNRAAYTLDKEVQAKVD